MQSARYFCPISMKLEVFQWLVEKYSNTKFHENPSSGNRDVPRVQTDGRDEANSRFFAILRTQLKMTFINTVII